MTTKDAATYSNSSNLSDQEANGHFLDCFDQSVNEVMARNGWVDLQASQLSEAELEQAAQMQNVEHDEQTRLFTRFLAMATNFSSARFTERLRTVPTLVQSITDLLEEMRREVAQFADIANEFEELVHVFGKLVLDTQHKMGMVLPHMCEAYDHIGVLSDVFKPDNETLFTATDREDIKIATDGLSHGMKQLIDLSRSSSLESRQLGDRINQLKTNTQTQRGTVQGRISLANMLSCVGPIGAASIIGRAVAAIIASESLGGAGLLVVAGVTCNPVSAIIYGALLGGSTTLAIAGLVHFCWTRRQHKALNFLNKISTGLMELANANMFFLDYLNRSEEAANTLIVQLEQIQRSITSERYRQRNAKLCNKALETIEQAIKSIEDIRNIETSRWLVSPSLPRFDTPLLALPTSTAQQ